MNLLKATNLAKQLEAAYNSELKEFINLCVKVSKLKTPTIMGANMNLYINSSHRDDDQWDLTFTVNHFQNEHLYVVNIAYEDDDLYLSIASNKIIADFDTHKSSGKSFDYYVKRIDLLRLITEWLPQVLG